MVNPFTFRNVFLVICNVMLLIYLCLWCSRILEVRTCVHVLQLELWLLLQLAGNYPVYAYRFSWSDWSTVCWSIYPGFDLKNVILSPFRTHHISASETEVKTEAVISECYTWALTAWSDFPPFVWLTKYIQKILICFCTVFYVLSANKPLASSAWSSVCHYRWFI